MRDSALLQPFENLTFYDLFDAAAHAGLLGKKCFGSERRQVLKRGAADQPGCLDRPTATFNKH